MAAFRLLTTVPVHLTLDRVSLMLVVLKYVLYIINSLHCTDS